MARVSASLSKSLGKCRFRPNQGEVCHPAAGKNDEALRLVAPLTIFMPSSGTSARPTHCGCDSRRPALGAGDRQDRQASCQPAQVAGGFDNKGYRGHQGWPESGSLPRFLEVFLGSITRGRGHGREVGSHYHRRYTKDGFRPGSSSRISTHQGWPESGSLPRFLEVF